MTGPSGGWGGFTSCRPGGVPSEDSIMRRLTCLATVFAAVLLCCDLLAASTVQDILRRADQARGNLEGVTWEVVLESIENARTETMTYEVKARGFDILGENLAPPRSRGNKILMLSGNMWFYKPGLSKPVPISRRQRLLGNAVYGDIASTNYANDYEATPLAEDNVDGEVCYVFDLTSKDKKTTYDRIKYWISKDRLVGVKAEYFTVSGKQFKSASMQYANTVEINGQARPFISRIVIYDELMSNDITTLLLRRPRLQPLPNYVFDLNLLMK
jgi:outer membrane lipoprotein-sorting protein